MTHTTIFITVLLFFSFSVFPQEQSININGVNLNVEQAFRQIEEQTGYNIAFNRTKFDTSKQITVSLKNVSIEKALSEILKGTGFGYKINGQHVVIVESGKSKTFSVNGYIRDAKNGEILSGATIVAEGKSNGAASNAYGYYTVNLPPGEHHLRWSYMGFVSEIRAIQLSCDATIDISLKQETFNLREVAVVADRNKITSAPGVNVTRMSIAEIRSQPAFLSEPDVMRSLQTLPGVQVSHIGSVNMSVRGGSYSQNLVLLDEAPVFNPSHILGFMSSFNPDAVSTVDLYKGVPARYGSKLSSVVDIRMKDGDRERFGVAGSVGVAASRLAVESPLWDGKGSFIVAGRYCYAGAVYKLIDFSINQMPPKATVWFYDLNAKVNYTINNKNRIYLSAYNGFDKFFFPEFSGEYLLEWGNLNGTLRWTHIVNPSLFINTSLIISRFGYSYYQLNDGMDYRWDASLGQIELKSDADHNFSDQLKLRYGVSLTGYGFSPGNITPRNDHSPSKAFSLDKGRSLETGLYAEADWELLPNLHLDAGLRFSTFSNIGPGTEYVFNPDTRKVMDSTEYSSGRMMQSFVNLNPRASIRYIFGKGSTLKASYTNMVQYLHKANNSTLGMPTDIWFPANKNAPPQLAHQFALGYSFSWGKGYTVSIEPYYKRMYRQIDFRDNADLFVNPYLDSEICSGNGQSKGIELMVEKMQGRFTGRISYTLSKTTFTIDGVNHGREYAAPYDGRHNLSVFAAYRLSDKLTVSAAFKYITGRPATVPAGAFNYQGAIFMDYTERNGYRIEDMHQLDFNLTWTPKPYKKRYRGSWNFSIINAYNRKNIFSIMVKPEEYTMSQYSVKKMYLHGIFPTFGYEFKF